MTDLSYKQTGQFTGRIRAQIQHEAVGSASYLRHRSSSPDILSLGQAGAKRRFSLINLIRRKSTFALHQQGIEETEEEHYMFDDSDHVKEQNEKLLVSFSDIYGGHENECHENRLFQPDSHDAEHAVTCFGRKGKDKGEFQDAKDITILSDNRLLITDLINSRLQLCNASGRLLLMYSGTDVAEPWATACIDNTTVAVTSRKNKCVRVLNLDGQVTNSFGENFFSSPAGLAIDNLGHFIVCDAGFNTVSVHNSNGTFLRVLGDPSSPQGRFSKPRYVCISSRGDIIVSDSGNHRIKIFNSSFEFVRSFGSFGKGECQFKSPYGVGTNGVGDIFVADHYNNRISMFTCNGVFIRHLVTSEHGLRHPQGLAVKSGAILFVSHGDLKASEILVYKFSNITENNDIDCICHL